MKKIIILFLLFSSFSAKSQDVLSAYIDSALENNIVLRQKNISLQKANYTLKMAKGLFYPNVGIQAGYQTADGGRDIDLPIGDMLNGVYTTLNKLTQTQKFPQLENQTINFLPANFYDVKVHTEVPIINSQLHYNTAIKEQQVQLSKYEVEIYKRELVEKVKTAYFQYLQSLDAIQIYHAALKLADEDKRVNERLLANGKGLPAYILRSQSEIETVNAQLTEASQNADNAKRYFNFLLNRDQQAPIDTVMGSKDVGDQILKSLNETVNISDREELKELNEAIHLQKNIFKMNKAVYYPTLNGFLDLGSQAENFQFNSQSRYYMAGVQLKIPLFEGNQNKNRIRQTQLSIQDAQLDLEKVTKQLALSSRVAQNNLKAVRHNYLSSQKRLQSAATYQRLIERGYREGVNAYIETIDARNQLTQARMAVSINRYKMWEAEAKLERETASYHFK